MEVTPQTALAQDVHATQALSIRRRYTTPGVHPFDTVEWELRDARIGHGDKVAFEQRDVEFPVTCRRTRPTSSARSTSAASSIRPRASARSSR